MAIRVERFEAGWAGDVGALITGIKQGEFGLPVTLDQQPDLRDIPGFYQQGSGDFWLALDGERLVGTIGLLDIGDGKAALRKMFVAPTHRGAEAGVARRLLDALVAHARARGLREIYLGTTDRFLAAHRFYEKNGFAAIDPALLPASFPRMAVDSLFFRLTLQPA